MRCILHHLLDRGMHIPRHRHCMITRKVGDLIIAEVADYVRNRQTRLARLVDDQGREPILPLHDAQVITIGPAYMVISGIERHEDMLRPPIEYAQSWWVEFSSGPPEGWVPSAYPAPPADPRA